MAFSDQTIGFYLAVEDKLSPVLKKATSNYDRFVKSLEESNAQAFQSAKKGMNALAAVLNGFKELPKQAAASYAETIDTLKKDVKTLKQPLDLVFTTKSKAMLTSAIASAVGKALSKVKLRMSASVPVARSKFFDTSVSLRAAYKHMMQPPDMLGMFKNIPKFAQGGTVTGGKGKGKDDVLAMLSRGEVVIPADIAASLKAMTDRARSASGQFTAMPQPLKDSLETMEHMSKVLEVMKGRVEAGLDPEAPKQYATALAASEQALKNVQQAAKGVDSEFLAQAGPRVKAFNEQLQGLKGTAEKLESPFEKLFGKILGPVRFLALRQALKDVGDKFSEVSGSAHGLSSELGVTKSVDTAYENFLQMNRVLGLGKAELQAWTKRVYEYAYAVPGAVSTTGEFTETLQALVNQNIGKELSLKLMPAVEGFSKATGIARHEVAGLASTMVTQLEMSSDQAGNLLANYRAIGVAAGVAPEKLIDGMQSATAAMEPFLRSIGPERAKDVLENTAKLVSAIESQAPGLGKSFGELLGRAASGSQEAITEVANLTGKGIDEVRQQLKKGGIESTLADIHEKFGNFANDPRALQGLERIGQAMGRSTEDMQKLATLGPKLEGTFGKVNAANVSMGDTVKYVNEQASAGQETWKTWAADADRWVMATSGLSSILGFFKEFNPMLLASIAYLIKTTAELVINTVALFTNSKAAKAAADATTKGSSEASSGISKIGSVIGSVGKGIGEFIGALGKGLGTAVAGLLQGVAAGLVALAPALALLAAPPVLLGLGALALGFIALGFALWLAAPAIEAVMNGVVGIFKVFATMDVGQILASAAAFPLLGIGFTLLGVGLAAFGLSALIAAPGLLALAGVAKLFKMSSGGEGIGSVLSAIVSTFNIDTGKLNGALVALRAATTFIVEFAKLAVIIGALAVGATIASAVDTVLSFFGVDSPMKKLANQGEEVVTTIMSLMLSFSTLAQSRQMQIGNAIADAVQKASMFVTQLGGLIAAMVELSKVEVNDTLFTTGPLTTLAANKDKIFGAVKDIMQEAQMLMQVQANPVITAAQINAATGPVTVNTENEKEVEATNTTNDLLRQLITLVSGGSVLAPVTLPVKMQSRSSLASDIARGEY